MSSSTTIRQLRHDLASKKISVSELVEERLKLIETKNSDINAFITVDTNGARETAKKLDALELDPAHPLWGIPIAHKDIFLTRGLKTTAASKLLADYVPVYSSTVVEKLTQAGAVSLGKLNCDAWAHGSSGENSDFGPTKNPANLEYVAGGSSSGSAAAVSAGLVMAATATDTGGSIRLPANFTGTVGFKPTYGRVSRYGIIAMASSLDSPGHITGCVEDAAEVFAITAGRDPLDATTAGAKAFSQLREPKAIKDLKIGVPSEYLTAISDKEVKSNFEQTLSTLTNLGAQIIELSLPHTEAAVAVYYVIQPAEVSSNLARFDGVRFGQGRDQFGAEARRRIMIGTFTLSAGYYDAYYKTALKVRTLIKQDFDHAFSQVDLLLAPVSPTPAFKLGEKTDDPLAMYQSDALTIPVNLAGVPAIALPSGQTKGKLPLGIQLIANRHQEESLFAAALSLEQAL
jgi:aspartyl-tRNA(Asn)/glutamyl-tRNA(Gln) amidotransferase subunit A